MEDILMADLGGTNIRFAVLCKGKISRFESYKCAEFDGYFLARYNFFVWRRLFPKRQ